MMRSASRVDKPASQASSVPFVDLTPVHEPVAEQILGDFAALIETGAFTNGPAVREFEEAFAHYCETTNCIGFASGLDALRLALIAAGIERGAEVLVPANTFIATFEAVTQAGGTPVPVDATEADYNIDVRAAEAAITARTRFIIPVHLYGQLADMGAVMALAARHDLFVLEDACQAHGAGRGDVTAGAAGDAAAFSFYPAKNLGAFGDAGALVTSDDELAAALRTLREHGQIAKYRHQVEGWTARLDTIQAIVLLRKLPHLDAANDARRAAAAFYAAALGDLDELHCPPVPDGSQPVWHVYAVRTRHRDDLAAFLQSRGIGVGLHYPEPPHLSAAYAHLGYGSGSFPTTEALANELLSLPMFPGITEAQLTSVCEAVRDFFRGG